MRILLLNTSFPPMARSAARIFHDLGRYLVSKGHQVSVVTEVPWRRLGFDDAANKYRNAKFRYKEIMDGIKVFRIWGFPFREGSRFGRGINALLLPLTFYLRACYAGQADIALVYSPPLTLGLASFLLKRQHNIPFVFNVQDIYPQTLIELGLMKNLLLIRFFEWMERFTYAHASHIVVHSEGNRRYLIDRRPVKPDRVKVIHNWVDTNTFHPSERLNEFRRNHGIGAKFLICYAGTMGHAQDLNAIIQAAKRLQEYDDMLFLLIGEGVREKEWKQKAEQWNLKNIRFLPLQPKQVYNSIVSAADVGIVPLIEDLRTPVVPGKLMDFMAGGRPVIATVNLDGDTSRIINEAKCGYAFTPDDVQGVTEALLSLYNDWSKIEQMGSNGRTYAERHFSLEACAAQYETLFRQLTGL
ncbi:glycosyltransferase family 4 protein [bacterium]|nr:glycosyltransferase family 4 protein [bacterium]